MSTDQVAGTDVVELVCHQEQLQVWADEMLADLAQGGYLYPDLSYADKVDLHRAVASEIKRIVSRAFDHPEAAAEIARLRAENGRYQAMVLRATEAIETIGEREKALRAEVAELRKLLWWCRPRLRRDAYLGRVNAAIGDWTPPALDEPKVVQSDG